MCLLLAKKGHKLKRMEIFNCSIFNYKYQVYTVILIHVVKKQAII